MRNDRLGANVLSVKMIANADEDLAKQFDLPKGMKSLGIITSDCDDVTYVALDEATKAAEVEVVYAKSMYGGAGNASTKLAGWNPSWSQSSRSEQWLSHRYSSHRK